MAVVIGPRASPRSLTVAALLVVSSAQAAVKLPYLLADHMVVQRDKPVHVWGKADPGEQVRVAFRGAERTVETDALGRWSVYLPPGDAGGPFQLTINQITLNDVLVGDV